MLSIPADAAKIWSLRQTRGTGGRMARRTLALTIQQAATWNCALVAVQS